MMQLHCMFEVDNQIVTRSDLESVPKNAEYPALFPEAKTVRLLRFWRGELPSESKDHKALSTVKNFEHVAYNLPKNIEGAPHYTADGRPAFQNQREVNEFTARFNDKYAGPRKAKWD